MNGSPENPTRTSPPENANQSTAWRTLGRVVGLEKIGQRRRPTYGTRVIQVLAAIWRAVGYPWSLRLKALLPLWLPWGRWRFRFTAALAAQLLRLSPRQMDRRLAAYRRPSETGRFGRTKPGTLLKHHIPLRTDRWDVTVPGFLARPSRRPN